MDLHLESLATGLVNVWRLDYGESATLGRERDRPADGGASADSRLDDLASGLVNHAVIIRFEADANGETFGLFFGYGHFVLSPLQHQMSARRPVEEITEVDN